MSFLEAAIKSLLIISGVFFLIFAYFCNLWTGRDPKKAQNIFTGLAVSFLFTFKILIFSFLVVFIISLFFDKIS